MDMDLCNLQRRGMDLLPAHQHNGKATVSAVRRARIHAHLNRFTDKGEDMAKYADLGARIIANSYISEDSVYNGSRCWVWMGKVKKNRRGVFYPEMTLRYKSGPRKGKVYNARVHRKSIEFFKGRRMTPKSVGMHLCNNSLCVNPEHLIGGSQKKNVQQCVADGRHFTPFRKAA